jgi:hypothetical protein
MNVVPISVGNKGLSTRDSPPGTAAPGAVPLYLRTLRGAYGGIFAAVRRKGVTGVTVRSVVTCSPLFGAARFSVSLSRR